MSESGWLELESDPGLFTLLVNDFGVKGVQVEEIYDLSKPIDNQVYGFIFLFKWNERRARRRVAAETLKYETDSSIVNSMFFAHQVIPNSCATHALLSVLLNCNNLYLGELLENFKKNCQNLTPDLKGKAIGNEMELFRAHNSYAKADRVCSETKSQSITYSASSSSLSMMSSMSGASSREVFHFICFVPINGRLYELDGLKPYPIDHGLIEESQSWTDRFKEIISERLGANSPLNISSQSPFFAFSSVLQSQSRSKQDIRFNLMSVVPDKIMLYENSLEILRANLEKIAKVINGEKNGVKTEASEVNGRKCIYYRMKAIEKGDCKNGIFAWIRKEVKNSEFDYLVNHRIELVNSSDECNGDAELSDVDFSLTELSDIEKKLSADIENYEAKLKEELEKRSKYKIDAQRRKHKYDEFIVTFLKMLVENGQLSELIQNQIKTKKTNISSSVITSGGGNGQCNYSQLNYSKKMKKK